VQDGGAVRAAGPSPQDPRLAGQVAQGQRPAAGQAVVAGEHGQRRVLEQPVDLDPAGQPPLAGRVGGPEAGHGGRQQGGGGAGEGRHPDAAGSQPGERPQLGVGGGQLGQDRVGPADQRLAGVGQPDAAAVPLDQPGPGLALQDGDLLGDRGLAVGERLGRGRDWRLWLALATVYVVWASTYLAIRVMVETVPPLLGAGLRFLLAGTVLYPFLVARRGWAAVRVPAGQVGASALVTVAERDVPSGLAAVLVAAMPLVVVVLRRLAGEPVGRVTAIGVTAGFAGVAVLLPGNPAPGPAPLGLGLILVATVSMAVASFVSSRLPVPGDTQVATALVVGSVAAVVGHESGPPSAGPVPDDRVPPQEVPADPRPR
jgi:EamA-like transporter family